MRTMLGAVAAIALSVSLIPSSYGAPPTQLEWQAVDVDTDQSLRGLDAVDASTAWVSGDGGGVWRTTDGGATWQDVSPPDSGDLLFRDVEAIDADTAHVLAIGEGDASRIYRTADGGATWEQTFVSDEPTAFYDCLAFWGGGRHGIGMSDPVDGRFRIITTDDAGATWQVADPAGMPDATGEFGFAASGTCLVTAGGRDAWLASGGAAARIYHSRDRGRTWTVSDSTIPASDAGGVFSLAFRNPRQGIAVGGDFLDEDNGVDMAATTTDGGSTWTNADDLGGYRSGVDWMAAAPRTAIAVGPSGSDVSYDGGRTWTTFSDIGYHAVQCAKDGSCWASGSGGRVARLAR